MGIRRTHMRSEAGVRLERIEALSAKGRVQQRAYRLTTRRDQPATIFMTEREACDAFDLEVIATLVDPRTQFEVD